MYAVRDNSRVFHLVSERGKQTVCGLSVAGFVLRHPTGATLHLSDKEPDHASLCKHCERLSKTLESDTY